MRPHLSALTVVLGLALTACGGDAADGDDASTTVPSDDETDDETDDTADDTADEESSDREATTTVAPATSAPTASTLAPPATQLEEVQPTVTPTDDTDPGSSDPPTGDLDGRPLVDQAIVDLRERLGDPTADITVVSVEEVDWPDGSIGCPQPGMSYPQVIVNGSKIVLRHDGVNYPYHQGGGRDVFYCPPTADR